VPSERPTRVADEHFLANAELPLFDPEALPNALGLDEWEVLADIYELFLTQLQGALAAFSATPGAADTRTLGELAHNLKSASGMVGAPVLMRIFSELETALEQDDQAALIRLLPGLSAAATETLRQIEQVLGDDAGSRP